jgi:hypothetical protein
MIKRPKKPPKMWVYSPPKPPKPKVPDDLKAEVTVRAEALIEELKPLPIKKPPPGYTLNYIVDLYTKWFRGYFYFCAKYACPGPNAMSPLFEARFARMEYVGNNRFNLSYLRHTGEWIELEQGLTLNECLKAIKEDPYYIA